MEWRHAGSPRKKKFRSQLYAGKVMATVFWDHQGVILVDLKVKSTILNSEAYIVTLRKLKTRLNRCIPNINMANILLQHDNARLHTSLRTREKITCHWWTTLPHPPYSPDLALSDFHFFDPLKEGLKGKRLSTDKEVKTAVRSWLCS